MRKFMLVFALLVPSGEIWGQRPSILRGSRRAIAEENRLVDQDRLSRMQSDNDWRRMVEGGYLKPVERTGQCYYVIPIGVGYHGYRGGVYTARPWVISFLNRECLHFSKKFGRARFRVTSLSRSGDYQVWLRRRRGNRNASPITVHKTGAVVDISKTGMTAAQIQWMRSHLAALERCNWVRATEERLEPTFHILVRRHFGQGQCDALQVVR